MNLDRINLLQLWVLDIFHAQMALKDRDKSAVRCFSYTHLTLLTLFSHFLCSYWGCGYITGHSTEFQCQSHGFNAMWTRPVGTKKSERLWNNIISKPTWIILAFFSITVGLKAREELQMLSAGPCKAFDRAPTTSHSPNCRDTDLMDALLSRWGQDWLDGCIQRAAVKGSMSQSRLVTTGVPQNSCL